MKMMLEFNGEVFNVDFTVEQPSKNRRNGVKTKCEIHNSDYWYSGETECSLKDHRSGLYDKAKGRKRSFERALDSMSKHYFRGSMWMQFLDQEASAKAREQERVAKFEENRKLRLLGLTEEVTAATLSAIEKMKSNAAANMKADIGSCKE